MKRKIKSFNGAVFQPKIKTAKFDILLAFQTDFLVLQSDLISLHAELSVSSIRMTLKFVSVSEENTSGVLGFFVSTESRNTTNSSGEVEGGDIH